MTNPALEALAALEHEQWACWAKALLETETLDWEREERWRKLINTPYRQLSEDDKEKDRIWARAALQSLKDNTSTDMIDAAQDSYEWEYEYGLSETDMRAAVSAALDTAMKEERPSDWFRQSLVSGVDANMPMKKETDGEE